jgi:hypothetical protein
VPDLAGTQSCAAPSDCRLTLTARRRGITGCGKRARQYFRDWRNVARCCDSTRCECCPDIWSECRGRNVIRYFCDWGARRYRGENILSRQNGNGCPCRLGHVRLDAMYAFRTPGPVQDPREEAMHQTERNDEEQSPSKNDRLHEGPPSSCRGPNKLKQMQQRVNGSNA